MRRLIFAFAGLAILLVSGTALAAGGVADDPAGTVPDRFVYYPGTEALAEEEVRVVACGTGMPDQRLSQASACFLLHLPGLHLHGFDR